MKIAMRNKDSNRLNVLRSILSQTLNASKTSNPVNTDMQVLALLRKSATASKAASEEFKSQGRQDLADKEYSQIEILEEYASSVELLGSTEIEAAVRSVIDLMKSEGGKLQVGDVLRRVFSPDVLGDRPVDKGEVAKLVKQVLGS